MKKILALVLALLMVVSVFAACKKNNTDPTDPSDPAVTEKDTYTYNTYMTALGTNWNPHTWEESGDNSMMSYVETPLADMTIKDSTTGEYQWIFVAASDIKDVTAANQADLTKYGSVLPEGKTAADITEGYVYEIKLRPEMKWENGTPINADTYVYSMQQLLNPEMQNYRANLYVSSESAIAGASKYYNSGAPIYDPVIDYPGEDPVQVVDPTKTDLYLNLTSNGMTIHTYSFSDLLEYGLDKDLYKTVNKSANLYGQIKVTEENKADVLALCDGYLALFSMSIYNEDKTPNMDLFYEFCFYNTGKFGEKFEYDATVGLYKVDEYTIRYVCQTAYDYYYFLTNCTSNWLVYKDLYEANKQYDADGNYTGSKYATSKETTMSYGAYKMASLEPAKQVVYVQNENYWEYTKDADGNLTSTTFFEVDGAKQPQFLTQKYVIDVMENDTAKLAFLSGKLDDWSPEADDVVTYSTSEQLYKVDETYTMRLFFHTALDSLKKLDASGANKNSVVLNNYNFRYAMSLAIDRNDWVSATAGYKPAYGVMNSLYYYDVYEDPASVYRNTDEAMQAICNVYGVKYGEGTPYATLKDAYASINGYNLTEAKALFTKACDELVAAGLYTKGEEIKIQIGWAKGAKSAADDQQITLLNKYLNAALEGTGFGTITLEGKDNLNDRYGDVIAGTYAIGFGGWGGAAFYPFRNFQVYCDPDEYEIHEAGCWDPKTETLTLTVNGVEETMTWQQWSTCMMGTGKYATADNETKLAITAGLEENIIKKLIFIPLASTTACSMMSYKTSNYTENYSIMYGFGGSRLMKYNYTDAEWETFVASKNGQIGY